MSLQGLSPLSYEGFIDLQSRLPDTIVASTNNTNFDPKSCPTDLKIHSIKCPTILRYSPKKIPVNKKYFDITKYFQSDDYPRLHNPEYARCKQCSVHDIN